MNTPPSRDHLMGVEGPDMNHVPETHVETTERGNAGSFPQVLLLTELFDGKGR